MSFRVLLFVVRFLVGVFGFWVLRIVEITRFLFVGFRRV